MGITFVQLDDPELWARIGCDPIALPVLDGEMLPLTDAFSLAMCLNETASIIPAWERTLTARPNEPKIAADASVCHLLAGNLARAHELADRSLQLEPADPVARIVKTLLGKIEERAVDPLRTWEEYLMLTQQCRTGGHAQTPTADSGYGRMEQRPMVTATK